MIREALELMLKEGQGNADVIVRPPAEPPHVYGVRKPDGTICWRTAEPMPGHHKAFTLQAIADVVKENSGGEDTDAPEVWYGPEAVVARFGDGLRSSITLSLGFSEPYLRLAAWKQQGNAVSQPNLVRELKTTFADCLERSGNLAESIKRVKFQTGQTINSEIGHGRASLGKEIEGQVTGVGIIPEYVVFSLPVFANPCFQALRAGVRCAIEPDPATGTFRVAALPGELEGAADAAMEGVKGELVGLLGGEGKFPVYYGKP